MPNLLSQLRHCGLYDDLSLHVYRLFARLHPGGDELVCLSAALAMQAVLDGHSCLALHRLADQNPFSVDQAEPGRDGYLLPAVADWQRRLLAASPLVGPPQAETALVLDQDRLYLRRYFDYELRLAREVRQRALLAGQAPEGVAPALARLFATGDGIDWQMVGAATAALKRLCLISGGPGTGKTHTVVRIIRLLQELAGEVPLRIGLAAPTGKAASRLQEALRQASRGLGGEATALLAAIQAQTIHRLLGPIRHSPYFRHDCRRRLPLDVLIVDEVSMVDLALMTKLIEAMPDEGRLILLGDKDQLSSVEAGRVLADLCGAEMDGLSPAFAARLGMALGRDLADLVGPDDDLPLNDCLVRLKVSYRFQATSGIGRLAEAVLAGDADGAMVCLAAGGEVGHEPPVTVGLGRGEDDERLARRLIAVYAPLLQAGTDPERALAAWRGFQLLCAHRHGPYGALHINHWLEGVLEGQGLIGARGPSAWYVGRPVMVTGNHYGLGLFNGDLGIALPAADGGLKVYFERPEGGVRAISPSRMPAHDTAFALTVHKSQGSEFERVLLVLPEGPSRLVSRELIYTAVTRARRGFELWGGEAALREGVRRTVERDTGLAARLREARPVS